MTFLKRFTFDVTATTSGAVTYSQYVRGGFVHAIRYTPATAAALATAGVAAFTISPLATGPSHDLLTMGTSAARMLYMKRETVTTGASASGGQFAPVPIAEEHIRLSLTLAASATDAANARFGKFEIYVDGA